MIRVGVPFVDHYRVPLRDRLPRWLLPTVGAVAVIALILAALAVVTARHHQRAAEQALCASRIETFYAHNPRLRAGRVQLVDVCAEWRTLAP